MVEEAQVTQKKRRERSPAYPGIDLETATQRLEIVHKEENRHFAPVDAITQHWGYKSRSSHGMVTLSALLKYGLLEDKGSGADRQAKITPLGLSIVLPEDAHERRSALKKAALTPPIISEIWEQYDGNLPSDASLRVSLIRHRNFNPSAVDDFIGILRRTIEYAKLSENDKISPESGGSTEDDHDEEKPPGSGDLFSMLSNSLGEAKTMQSSTANGQTKQNDERQTRIVQVPVNMDTFAAFQLPTRMSETEWKQLLVGLAAMKPGFVRYEIKPEEVPELIEKALQDTE